MSLPDHALVFPQRDTQPGSIPGYSVSIDPLVLLHLLVQGAEYRSPARPAAVITVAQSPVRPDGLDLDPRDVRARIDSWGNVVIEVGRNKEGFRQPLEMRIEEIPEPQEGEP